MSTTIPPFGWPVPSDTDPLADGAGAIRALAASIAATVDDTAARRIWTFSGGMTFNASGNFTMAHGLGAVPQSVSLGCVLGSSAILLALASAPSSTTLTVRAFNGWSTPFVGSLSQVWILLVGGPNSAVALPEAPEE